MLGCAARYKMQACRAGSGLNLDSAPEFRCSPQIHEYSAPGQQCACTACLVLCPSRLARIIGLRHTCRAQFARCCPHSVCLARIAGSRARLAFVETNYLAPGCNVHWFSLPGAPHSGCLPRIIGLRHTCRGSACLARCTQVVWPASLGRVFLA